MKTLPDTDIEDLARKIMQANPALGWHSAWIKAVRLIRSL
jgi:hypothetical protein